MPGCNTATLPQCVAPLPIIIVTKPCDVLFIFPNTRRYFMSTVNRFILPLAILCTLAFATSEALAQSVVCNTGTCTWTIDYTTNMRLSTGPALLPPAACYAPALGAGEVVVFIRIDGVNYVPPVPPNCAAIPPNATCMSLAHFLCRTMLTGWTIN